MNLNKIEKKVLNDQRLSFEDGVTLFNSNDLIKIGRLANIIREKKNSNNTFFINNHHINHTNICINKCRFCAFGRTIEDADAYAMSIEEVLKAAESFSNKKINEFHVVGGLHPDLPFQYYINLINALHAKYPDVHIQAFTAVEIAHFAKIANLSAKNTLISLKNAGLGSLPGGGAEIFNERVRKKICPDKISGTEWLDVMKTAHSIGLKSNATMLYGHIETVEDRVDHLVRLRDLQDQTGGFLTFIPLAFHPKNTDLGTLSNTGGSLDLKTIAVSRLMLDNFAHIKTFWIMVGLKIAQISLSFGADDIDGTVQEEKITHAAGADTDQATSREELVRIIHEAGRVAVERDTLYNRVA